MLIIEWIEGGISGVGVFGVLIFWVFFGGGKYKSSSNPILSSLYRSVDSEDCSANKTNQIHVLKGATFEGSESVRIVFSIPHMDITGRQTRQSEMTTYLSFSKYKCQM